MFCYRSFDAGQELHFKRIDNLKRLLPDVKWTCSNPENINAKKFIQNQYLEIFTRLAQIIFPAKPSIEALDLHEIPVLLGLMVLIIPFGETLKITAIFGAILTRITSIHILSEHPSIQERNMWLNELFNNSLGQCYIKLEHIWKQEQDKAKSFTEKPNDNICFKSLSSLGIAANRDDWITCDGLKQHAKEAYNLLDRCNRLSSLYNKKISDQVKSNLDVLSSYSSGALSPDSLVAVAQREMIIQQPQRADVISGIYARENLLAVAKVYRCCAYCHRYIMPCGSLLGVAVIETVYLMGAIPSAVEIPLLAAFGVCSCMTCMAWAKWDCWGGRQKTFRCLKNTVEKYPSIKICLLPCVCTDSIPRVVTIAPSSSSLTHLHETSFRNLEQSPPPDYEFLDPPPYT